MSKDKKKCELCEMGCAKRGMIERLIKGLSRKDLKRMLEIRKEIFPHVD